MDLGLHQKSVIVTAGSKGLGKATAEQFAAEGAHVLIASRNEFELEKARNEIISKTDNQNVNLVVCDMTKPEDIKRLVERAVELNGTVDVLINNTGGPPAGPFEKFSDEDWVKAFELNLLSFVRTTREVIPYMKKQNSGRIVHFASSSIKQTLDNLILSNTFRAGIVGLSKSLSQELGQFNILVNTIGPGKIATERIGELDAIRAERLNVSPAEIQSRTEKTIPMGRYGEPSEFAKAALFLGSFANTYVSGQIMVVDGGMVKAL